MTARPPGPVGGTRAITVRRRRGPYGGRSGYAPDVPTRFHDVAIEALRLDEADRLRLAAELIDSVEGRADPRWERAWSEEIQRRSAAAAAREARGEPRGVAWTDARAAVLRRLAER